jgi:hypothetical protein
MDKWMIPPFTIMILCLLFAFGTIFLVACEPPPQPQSSKFNVGQTVTISQTSEKTLIVEKFQWGGKWRYECRVASPTQQHRDGVFARDTEITRYALVTFYEFELKD